MKIYNRYILTAAIVMLVTTIILAAMNTESLNLYFTVYFFEVLVITQLFVHLNKRARKGLNIVNLTMMVGFTIGLIYQVLAIML